MTKLDPNAPYLKGKVFEISENGKELLFPPADYKIIGTSTSDNDLSLSACNQSGCGGKVVVTDEGNAEYAWWYLTNRSTKNAVVTIERRWIYQGWQSETLQFNLYPGQHIEAFSFPRNQQPMVCIIACA